ncbi:MAG: IS110 family transposase, partial [Spirochaetota bacterium]
MTNQKRYVGIDMSKRSFEVAIVQDESSTISRKKYTASPEGKQAFISSLCKEDVVGFETGNSSFLLAKLIQKKVGCKVYVLNAGKLHLIFKSLKKSDKEDALRIAKFIQRTPEEELPTVAIPSDEEMVMRSSATERLRINRARTQSINAFHSLLWNNGIVDYERNELKQKYSRDKAVQNLPEIYQNQAKRLITLIDLYEQHLQEIDEEQKKHLRRHPKETTISMSIPGIGPTAAFVQMCYLGNMERFASSKQVTYFSGYTPKLDISGDQKHYGAITKRG